MNSEHRGDDFTTNSADVFDLRSALLHIWDSCRVHAWIIVLCPIITIAFVTFYVVNWQPIYTAKALLLAEAKGDTTREQFYYFWNMFRKEDAKSEVGMMTSNAVLSDVVKQLGLT